MRTFRVGFDFHGVLVNVQPLKQKIVWDMLGVLIAPHLLKRHIVVSRGFMTHQQYDEMLWRLYEKPEIILDALPYPRAIRTLAHHLQQRNDVWIITASGDAAFQSAMLWCDHYLPFSKNVRLFGSGQDGSKAEIAKGVHIHTEDEIAPLITLEGIVPHRFLMARAYNAFIPPHPGITLVQGFHAYVREVWHIRHLSI